MAKGWINHSRSVRQGYANAPRAVSESVSAPYEVVRPGTYSDGQDRMGVPAGMEHRTAKNSRYGSAESKAYRASLRGAELSLQDLTAGRVPKDGLPVSKRGQ